MVIASHGGYTSDLCHEICAAHRWWRTFCDSWGSLGKVDWTGRPRSWPVEAAHGAMARLLIAYQSIISGRRSYDPIYEMQIDAVISPQLSPFPTLTINVMRKS